MCIFFAFKVSIFINLDVISGSFYFPCFSEKETKGGETERTKASVRAANATPRDDKRGPSETLSNVCKFAETEKKLNIKHKQTKFSSFIYLYL